MRISSIFITVLFGLTFVSSASAQDDCSDDGVVLYGQPTEVVVIGPEVAEIQPLTTAESIEFELVVTCRGGYLLHASREGRTLSYTRSGCYHVFSAPHSQITAVDPSCNAILGDRSHDYVEIIRNGIYQIIYRGRLTQLGL